MPKRRGFKFINKAVYKYFFRDMVETAMYHRHVLGGLVKGGHNVSSSGLSSRNLTLSVPISRLLVPMRSVQWGFAGVASGERGYAIDFAMLNLFLAVVGV